MFVVHIVMYSVCVCGGRGVFVFVVHILFVCLCVMLVLDVLIVL